MYKLTGPRTDPCKTPNGRRCGQDSVPYILMLWCLSEKLLFEPPKSCARNAKMSIETL